MSRPESLRDRCAFRLQRLQHGVIEITNALAGCGDPPGNTVVAAVAWNLSSIYTEMEEVFKGICESFGESMPGSESWHRNLLGTMRTPTAKRARVISDELFSALDMLLAFRHRSRYATFPDLDWSKMRPLVDSLTSCVRRFEGELRAFLKGLEGT